jgi:NAD(P)-dependent dehydrogenase (short-subunit alcohol dehydrogenase family)
MSAQPERSGQTVAVIGVSSGVGLELRSGIAAFDTTDYERLGRFFDELATPIDHVLVTGPGPYYAPLAQSDVEAARRDIDAHLRRGAHGKRDV